MQGLVVQLLLREFTADSVADLTADVDQQILVVIVVVDMGLVALYHDNALDPLVDLERHSQPGDGLETHQLDVAGLDQILDPRVSVNSGLLVRRT